MLIRFFSGTTPDTTPQSVSATSTSSTPNTPDFFEKEFEAYALITEFKEVCTAYINSSRFDLMTHKTVARYIISQLDALYKSESDEASYLFEVTKSIFSALHSFLEKQKSKIFADLLKSFAIKYPIHFSDENLKSVITKYSSVIEDLIYFLNANCANIINGKEANYPQQGVKHFATIYNDQAAIALEQSNKELKDSNEVEEIATAELKTTNLNVPTPDEKPAAFNQKYFRTTEELVHYLREDRAVDELQAITQNAPTTPTSELYSSLSPVTFVYSPPSTPDLASSAKLNPYQHVNKHFGIASFSFLSTQFMIHIEGIENREVFIEENTFTKNADGSFSRKIAFVEDPADFNLESSVMKESIHFTITLALSKRAEFLSKIQHKLGQPHNFIQSNYIATLTTEDYKTLLIESYKAIIQNSYEETYGNTISLTQHHRPRLG